MFQILLTRNLILSNPFGLFGSLSYLFAQLVHIKALDCREASIYRFYKWTTDGRQLIATTMDVWLVSLGKGFEALGRDISKRNIGLGYPLISDHGSCIKHDNMRGVGLMSLIGKWAHHFYTILFVKLN